ncbi:sugar transferase [Microbacterium sp. M3]|uniref:Sugar transferase n=1 Tax=Microbacterium arthrosphaerae TaxID=792652 RepID=A0ABU4H2Q5_9MICO|nr:MULTISPECIES: sugar transferase [Microbacterium]MDW4573616.1 sugar transferase [Microbacterium arthrosphaerae]MDW7607471.1 sugar transferase [Microbacterium sp. M3]
MPAALAPRVQPSLERRHLWERRYRRRLVATDAVCVTAAALAAMMFEAGGFTAVTELTEPARIGAFVVWAWMTLLWLARTREATVLGAGAAEYMRIGHATGFAFGILSTAFIVAQLPGLRAQLIVALPVGLVALILSRRLWRKWLVHERQRGECVSRVLVAGTRDDVEYVIDKLVHDPHHAYLVIGATTTEGVLEPIIIDDRHYPVIGSIRFTAAYGREAGADTIVVASTPDDDRDFVRRLGWELEGSAAELVLCNRLTDVAGPRLSLRPLDGLPLVQVKIPEFEGGVHAIKRGMDVVLALLALLPIALVAPFVALAIKIDSRGPVLFHQLRVGRDGRQFWMLKFRTMVVDAEEKRAELLAANDGAGPLFKLKRDPRVTRVGAILRRFSIDELPQFVNVLRGDMSIVGPRPPLPTEVGSYDGTVYRRLYIKPGITGLWQISGRSDLSWDDSVRLDLRYVENWSIATDLMIMWRTAKVMIRPRGAY